MVDKRPWLGIRLAWRSVNTYCGAGRSAVVDFRKLRLPWLVNRSLITAVIYPDHRLEFFDAPAIADLNDTMKPFWTFDRETFSLNAISDLTPWPAAQGLYFEFTGFDLTEEYRSIIPVNDFIDVWRSNDVPGWWILDRRGEGITLVRDYESIDGAVHAVEISYRGLSVYKYGFERASDLADHDRIHLLKIEHLEIDQLIRIFSKDAAISIRHAARFYHLTMYTLATVYELPL
jgi:hypothetical protein